MRFLILAALLPSMAWATNKPANPKPPEPAPQSQSQSQGQNQQQSQAVQANSGGGQSNANVYSADRTTALAFGTTAPIPAQPAECWFPKKGFGRGHSVAFGLWQASAVLERDEQCVEDLREAREFELERLRLEAQLERARLERITAERVRTVEIAK